MRIDRVIGCLVLFAPLAALAQNLPVHAVRTMAPVSPTPEYFISGDSIEPMILAEWEVIDDLGSRIRIVWGKEAVDQAPANASRYEQKTYSFSTGTIRVLDFKAVQGGMVHAITSETAIFMLKGTGTVDVAGETIAVAEGDVVSYPSGVIRSDGDATVIAWAVTGTKINEAAKAMHVRAADAPVINLAEWDVDGKRVRASTPNALKDAPADAIRLSIKRYVFDGNSVRVANSKQGGPTTKTTGTQDSLIYVTSGKLRFFQDDSEIVAGPGDAIREIAGHYHNWYRIEDSSFVATSSLPINPLLAANP